MARNIDPNDLSREDVLYIRARPWLVREMEMQGFELPELDSFDEDDNDADEPDENVESYSDWTVARLKQEIAERNKDRDEDDEIVPEGSNKPQLVAALEADDEDDESEE